MSQPLEPAPSGNIPAASAPRAQVSRAAPQSRKPAWLRKQRNTRKIQLHEVCFPVETSDRVALFIKLYNSQERSTKGDISWLQMTFAWNRCLTNAFADDAPLDIHIKSEKLLRQLEASLIEQTRARNTAISQSHVQRTIASGIFRAANSYSAVQTSPAKAQPSVHASAAVGRAALHASQDAENQPSAAAAGAPV